MAKALTPVRIELANGDAQEGALYLAKGERLQDMLNGTGGFVPFRVDNRLMMIGKTQIACVELLLD
ncbi:MAG: hypothetical protein AAF205_10675 [Pseudomonadota bacterium]